MDRKHIVSILVVAVLAFVGSLLLTPPNVQDEQVRLPWRVMKDPRGDTQVFGFTLGKTPLREVQQLFGEEGTISLFQTPGAAEPLTVEVFFEQVYLQSLRADFIMTLDVDQGTLAPMFERGLRISQMESGDKRIKLDPLDVEQLRDRPIRGITYLPQARLDAETVERRFGPPQERRTDIRNQMIHWYYPDRGFDIGRTVKGRLVIQYANREDVQRLALPRDLSVPEGDPLPAPATGNP